MHDILKLFVYNSPYYLFIFYDDVFPCVNIAAAVDYSNDLE